MPWVHPYVRLVLPISDVDNNGFVRKDVHRSET